MLQHPQKRARIAYVKDHPEFSDTRKDDVVPFFHLSLSVCSVSFDLTKAQFENTIKKSSCLRYCTFQHARITAKSGWYNMGQQ